MTKLRNVAAAAFVATVALLPALLFIPGDLAASALGAIYSIGVAYPFVPLSAVVVVVLVSLCRESVESER